MLCDGTIDFPSQTWKNNVWEIFFKKRTGRRTARYIKKKKNPNGELCTEKCELRMRITKDQRGKKI